MYMTLKKYLETMKTTDRVEVVYWDESKLNLATLFNHYVYNVRTSKTFKTYNKYVVVAHEQMDNVNGQILYIRRAK